jgi:hypothetical protein
MGRRRIFDGMREQLCDHYIRLEQEKEAAAREQRERLREAERAREPKSSPDILSRSELLSLRKDPELIAMCSSEPPVNEVYQPVWMIHPPEFFLSRGAELQLLVCGASGGLEACFSCENMPQSTLIDFAKQAVRLGGEIVEQTRMPGAPATSLNGAAYEFLHRGGFLRNQLQYKPRNFTLYWRAPQSATEASGK